MLSLLNILASFTAPEEIKMNPQSLLWALPLAASIAVIYKAIKVPKITAKHFIKDTGLLFISIVAFLIAASIVLIIVAQLATT